MHYKSLGSVMTKLRHILSVVCVLAVAGAAIAVAPAHAQDAGAAIEIAQAQPKRNLFDLLFGPGEKVTPKTNTQNQRPRATNTPSVTTLAPSKPVVEKVIGATRLAVFGDSLAVDLAKALERAHEDDPNLVVNAHGVGSSGFVRDDFYDWNGAITEIIAADGFDIAVVIIGINDRQPITVSGQAQKPLSDKWKTAYADRLIAFLGQLRAAGKPVIWVGLPPMKARTYSVAMTQISSIHQLASFSGGAEFVDIYERFANEDGNYTSTGPDLNGNHVVMRKTDGIHFSRAGSDKLAFYINQSLKNFYRGGAITIEISDALEGTDAQAMIRMPFQGLGQIRLLEVAGAVVPLTGAGRKASQFVVARNIALEQPGFDLEVLVNAPIGRADAFGVGFDLTEDLANEVE